MVNATKSIGPRFPSIPPGAIERLIGVDFSGAAQSGKTAWLAELVPLIDGSPEPTPMRFRVADLQPLGRLAGADDRDSVNGYLVDRMKSTAGAFWGCDFPFGLPVELLPGGWPSQLRHVAAFDADAKAYGLELVAMTERALGVKHVRRRTDRETQTPFDCYHYRIIYQTFHGMRDVLRSVSRSKDVAVLPFQYRKVARAKTGGTANGGASANGGAPGRALSYVVEACPASTLKRLSLPHQRYKQSGGKPPERLHQQTRREILRGIASYVELSPYRRRVIMNDPGGDALDAVLPGLGAWLGAVRADHEVLAGDDRYPHEGFVFC